MKKLILLIFLSILLNEVHAQIHLGYGINHFYSKPNIRDKSGHSEIFQIDADWSNPERYTYYLGFTNKRWQAEFQLNTQNFSTFINTRFEERGFSFKIGNYWVPGLYIKYKIPVLKNYPLVILPSVGVSSLCGNCTKKAGPNYIPNNSTSKSPAISPQTGAYANGWESEYNTERVYLFNAALNLQYTFYTFHTINIGAQVSAGNNWSYRHTVYYENNGINPGNDKYEDAHITIEQRHFSYNFYCNYQLNLDFKAMREMIRNSKRLSNN